MSFELIGMILLLFLGIGLIFLAISFVLYRGIILDYKQMSTPMTAEELFMTLSSIITAECKVIENDKFSRFGNNLDNQSFENYYNYLTRKILNDLSDSFMYRASFIMSEDAIVDLICRNITDYLQTKLASGAPEMDTNNDL